jgi:chemotaxis protein methyltransferase CheR
VTSGLREEWGQPPPQGQSPSEARVSAGLSEQLLSQLSEFVAAQMGLYFPRERWPELERGLQSAAREFGAANAEACARWLLAAPLTRNQIEILAADLTVGETYFFRDQRSFEILGEQVLPELMRARSGAEKRLRIWSAGCCTGEEPYSIAIWLDRVLPGLQQWHVTILATDVNPRFLRKAAAGVFREWSFRGAPPWLKESYFVPVDAQRFELLPRIRERVKFAYLNLAQDTYPSLATDTNAMDLIFCRNVLMYFAPEQAGTVITKLYRALIDAGWLIVSPSETSSQLFCQFASMHFDGAILYKKQSGAASAPAPAFWTQMPAGRLHEDASAAPSFALDSVAAPAPSVFPVQLSSSMPLGSGPVGAEAIRTIEQESPANPEKPAPYAEALALFERGNYLEAAQLLKADPASLRGSAQSWALLARICANLGDLAEARSWAEKAVAANKLDAGLHYLRAIILQEQGIEEEAVASLKRALYLATDFVLAHFALGHLARRHGKSSEADKHFSNALTLLQRYQADEVLPHSDGLAAGRLGEMIRSTRPMDDAA